MNRREWLTRSSVLVAAGAMKPTAAGARDPAGSIWTVTGPIEPGEMGRCLPHEHVLVDFIGADGATPDRYDADTVFGVVRPHMEEARRLGVRTMVECTPAYLGRDPALLDRLSRATGVQLLTNTGYYAANGGKHLPPHARTESAQQLSSRWVAEWRDGIGDTGIKPGFIKIGYDRGPLGDVVRTLVEAAAHTHLATGLAIAAHSGDGVAALEALDLITREGCPAAAFIWVHAQNEREPRRHLEAAARGAWVELDGIGPSTIERHIEPLEALRDAGKLDRVLLAHDAGWYHVGEPGGGRFRPYDTLFTTFLPALRQRGFNERQIDGMTIASPARAFTVVDRARGG